MFERLFNFMFDKKGNGIKTIYVVNREIKKNEMIKNKIKKSSLLKRDNEDKIYGDEYDIICEKIRISRLQSFHSY